MIKESDSNNKETNELKLETVINYHKFDVMPSVLSTSIHNSLVHSIWRFGPLDLSFNPEKEVNKNVRRSSKHELALSKLGKTKIISSAGENLAAQGRKRIFSVDFGSDDLISNKVESLSLKPPSSTISVKIEPHSQLLKPQIFSMSPYQQSY